MGSMGIFDREVVQSKCLLDMRQHLFVRLVQSDPDEAVRMGPGIAQVGDRHVGHSHPIVIGSRVDHAPLRWG